MSVYFDDSEILKAETIDYLEGAKAARRFILEDKYTLLRGLIGDFTELFGKSPANEKAQSFLQIMQEELENVKSDLSEIYGRRVD